jgi:hypothetical protein
MTIAVGQSVVNKQGMSVGTQAPLGPVPAVEASYTQRPVHVAETGPDRKVLTHRHFGHPEEHPVTLRHRKASADPMHGEEDKIIDEYKDLYDKARKGECNPPEMRRIQELRGRLQEIQATRETDARRILGDDMLEGADVQGHTFSLKPKAPPAQPAPRRPSGSNLLTQTASLRSGKTFKGEGLAKARGPEVDPDEELESSVSWSLDAVVMVSDSILKAVGEPSYPADEPEDDGIHGSMARPAYGSVAHDIEHPETEGPYSGSVTSGEVANKAGKPKGWGRGSSRKFWESVSKGPHSKCMEHVGGTVDDPHAFCAWAEHEGTGHWPAERREEKAAEDVRYLRPDEQPPQGTNVQQGPRGGRFVTDSGGQLHPKDVEEVQSLKVRRPQRSREESEATADDYGERMRDMADNDPAGGRLQGQFKREWARSARAGDLSHDDAYDLVDPLADLFMRTNPHEDPDVAKQAAMVVAEDIFSEFAAGLDEDPARNDHPSLSPGERNPSMGRWSSDPVVVPSSANVYKGAAYAQRPLK